MYEEIFIMFKDGRKEWISPIEDLENYIDKININ